MLSTEYSNPAVEDLIRLLRRGRFDLSTEKHLQAGVEQVLSAEGVRFEREKGLSDRDIPDFLVSGGIVIECKLHKKARKMEVYRQLCRYAEHADVTAIILASNISMGLPTDINGKPTFVASLSHGWL